MKKNWPNFSAAASALIVGAIFANALWFQDGRHPAPLFRGTESPAQTKTAQTPRDTAKQTQNTPPVRDAAGSHALLRDIQKSLANLGYYRGKIDGKMGPQTRAGLIAYQRAHALEPNGLPSITLLKHTVLHGRRPAPLPPILPSRRADNQQS